LAAGPAKGMQHYDPPTKSVTSAASPTAKISGSEVYI